MTVKPNLSSTAQKVALGKTMSRMYGCDMKNASTRKKGLRYISLIPPEGEVREAQRIGQSDHHQNSAALRRTGMDEIESVSVHAESSSFGDY